MRAYMDFSSAPVQPLASKQAIESIINMVLIYSYTCVSALMLFVTFCIVVTRFRLWHTNKFLKMIPQLANKPVNNLINQALGFSSAYRTGNILYLIWVVTLLIAFDNVFTNSCYSLLESVADRRSREYLFLYNFIFTGVLIIKYKAPSEFHHPLLALMSLVLAKFFIRIFSYVHAERAYGLENINLVAEYMKSEHKLVHPSDAIDPTSMKGYKYLVMGEEKIKSKIEAPDYSPEIELTDDVITVERVWSCNKGLLHPSVDTDGAMKDVCLSFSLFKLLRRRHFGYPAAEAQEPKTRKLIFEGLLSEKGDDKERVFRVIKMELSFLCDLIFTRYPVGFAFGFPVWNLVLLGGMIGVTLWFKYKAYLNRYNYMSVNNIPLDYLFTSSLLILILVMEFFEMLTYVFCHWTKLIMICRNVKSNSSLVTNQWASSDANLHEAQPWLFGCKVLAFFCKPRFNLSVKNTLGQYSMLTNSSKTHPRSSGQCYSLISTCEVSKINVPLPGLKKGKSVPLSPEVKKAIFDTLVESRGELTNGMATLKRNGEYVYDDLKWTLDFSTPIHTIMVWHIATSFCAIRPVNVGGNKELIKSDLKVATHLSNYCAYLVAYLPDQLPLTSHWVKSMFRRIVEETNEFFARERTLEAKYSKLMSSKDGGQKIINRGSELGWYLIEKMPDDAKRWKLMADFWSELILYLAPLGSSKVHFEELGNGSEFITHLWALLYHAGIIDTTNAEYHP